MVVRNGALGLSGGGGRGAYHVGVLRFLEEALCNVEQHASDVTRLQVTCKQEADNNIIRVSDNGRHQEAETLMTVQASATRPAERTGKYTGKYTGKRTHTAAMQKESYYAREGDGSRQAKRLAKRLKGQFSRQIKVPKGTVCELVWPIKHKMQKSVMFLSS